MLAVLGALHAGINNDEATHTMRLRHYFHDGWYATDGDYRGDGPGSAGTQTFVYAPVTTLLLHAWTVLWGGEGWGQVSTSAHAYDLRHLGTVLIGLVGVAAVVVMGRVLLHHWRWGLVAGGALAAVPMWTGHEMSNVKDLPVATGYSLVTLALLLFVRAGPPRPGQRVGRWLCLVAGLMLTLGTRPGMWAGVFVVLVVAVVAILLAVPLRRAAVVLAEILAGLVTSAAALLAIYPKVFGSPLRALTSSADESSHFVKGARATRWYVPTNLAADMPTLLLLFVLLGTVLGLVTVVRSLRVRPVVAGRIALVGAQAFALPVVAIILRSDLYSGLRHLLFAIPAMAVLAAYGMARLASWWRGRFPGRRVPVGAIAALALVLPLVDQVTMQPYEITYVNLGNDVLSRTVGTEDLDPGDYWRVSVEELVRGVDLDHEVLCKATTNTRTDIAYPFINGFPANSPSRSVDCREEPLGSLAPLRLPVPRDATLLEFDAVFLKKPLPRNCTQRAEVTRWQHGFEKVLSVLGRCTVEPARLTAAGVRADSPSIGKTSLHDLWRFAVSGWEQWPRAHVIYSRMPQAALLLDLRELCPHGCDLVVSTARVPADLRVRVDGEPVAVTRDQAHLRIPLGAQVTARPYVDVRFTRASGDGLGLDVRGLRAEQPGTTRP